MPPDSVQQMIFRHKRLILSLSFLIAIALSLIGYVMVRRWWNTPQPGPFQIRTIAILPFENLSGDPKQDYFADGMTDQLISDLGQVGSLNVISRTSVMRYKGAKKELPQIAKELRVRGVVEGAVSRTGNKVQVTVRLVDAKTNHLLWSHTYLRDITDILALHAELAQAIANEVRTTVTPETRTRLARTRSVNIEAEDLYLQGMMRLNAGDPGGAIAYLNQSVAADGRFAPAHAALARCYGALGEGGHLPYADAFFRQKTEAKRAVELDESLPEGHSELANAAMNLEWDWATAKKEFLKALDLNPSLGVVRTQYGTYLKRIGKITEAIDEAERGMSIDPLSANSYSHVSFAFYSARQYDRALSIARGGPALGIGIPEDSFLMGAIYVEREMYPKAIAEFLKLGDFPRALGHLGNAYARNGQIDEARKVITQLETHVQQNGLGRYEIALVYAGMGKPDEAFHWLQEAYRTHDEGIGDLKIDPCLDPLRSDSRFDELVRMVGFPTS